jgi:transcriptional regulator with XRE-family HTH domain
MGKKRYDESKRHHFGAWLRFLRKDRNLSQEELALVTGIPLATISYWERTGKLGNAGRILALAKALGVKIETLLKADTPTKLNVSDAYMNTFLTHDRQKRAGFKDA